MSTTERDAPALLDLVRRMPKAELHIHVEGSLEPELMFHLAQRNGVALAYPNVEALRAAYAFTDLQSFLDILYAGCSVLLNKADFYESAGGSATTPNWYKNLMAAGGGEVQVGADRWPVAARELADGPERDECWALATAAYAGFDSYQTFTDRIIPVAVLSRRED